ncbi:MAG: hypothetical protein ACXWQQ_02715 [Pseudobdellovibrio sp.]
MRIQNLRDLHLFFPDIDGFWNHQNLIETEQRIRAELPFGEGAVSASQIEALTQAVRLFCLQGKMKEAKEFLSGVEQHLKVIAAEDSQRLRVRYFLEEGRYFSLSMSPVRAIESFRQAWEIAHKIKKLDFFAVDAAYMVSITLPVKARKDWLNKALEISEASEAGSLAAKWRPYLCMQTGWYFFDSHDFFGAQEYFNKARSYCDEENIFLARNLKWCSARVARAMGQFDTALATQKEILMEMTLAGEEDGFVYLEIAECCQSKQDYAMAAVNFGKAYERLKENNWYSENFSDNLKEILKKSKPKYH